MIIMRNKIYRSLLASLILFFIVLPPAFSQEKFGFSFDFVVAQPQGDFAKYLKNSPIGGGFNLAYRLSRSPLVIGLSLNLLQYGREVRTKMLSPNIPELYVDVVTANYMLLGHVFVRFWPQKGKIRPYIEGLIGFNYLETNTSLENAYTGYGSYSFISAKNASDWASSLGLGGGLTLRVATIGSKKPSPPFTLQIDMGLRYLRGSEARYLRKGDIERFEGVAIYHFCQSRTDLLRGSISLYLWF